MQPLSLWPVQMYTFTWSAHSEHQTELKRVCHKLEDNNHISNVSNSIKQGLYESAFDFAKTDNTSVLAWGNWVKECVFNAAKHANSAYWTGAKNVSIELHESWCHITRDGGYHDNHIHPNSSWSGIYYLDCGDMDIETKNGVNRFYNPMKPGYVDAGTAWSTSNSNIDINPTAGMMVVFPSWIDHSAMPYRGTKNRYILSFNSQIGLVR